MPCPSPSRFHASLREPSPAFLLQQVRVLQVLQVPSEPIGRGWMLPALLPTIILALLPPSASSAGPAGSAMALAHECAPFERELAVHLVLGGAEKGGIVLRGRQSLIFGAGPRVVKYVGKQHTEQKISAARQRSFVESCRREVDFYAALERSCREDGERCAALAALFPRVSLVLRTPVSSSPVDEAFVLVMDNLAAQGFVQPPSLTEQAAASALDSLAALHAHHWGDTAVLAGNRGGFWALERRPSEEMDAGAAQERWAAVAVAFSSECRGLPQHLGRDLALAARHLDAAVASTAVTMMHGDAKPANLFSRPDAGPCKLIDMQWCGKGNPLSDVAYLVSTSLHPDLLRQVPAAGGGGGGCSVELDDAAAEEVVARRVAQYSASLMARLGEADGAEYQRSIQAQRFKSTP
jgi:hypothetical protein